MFTRYVTPDSTVHLKFAEWVWEMVEEIPYGQQAEMMRFLFGVGQ